MTQNTTAHNITQDAILNNMFDKSMKMLEPAIDMVMNKEEEKDQNKLDNYMRAAKTEWISMMRQYLSTEEIDCLVQAFFYASKIDEKKLVLFNTVFTQRVSELAEQHFR